MLKLASAIIVSSDYEKETLKSLGVDPTKMFKVYLPVDLDEAEHYRHSNLSLRDQPVSYTHLTLPTN